MLGGGKWNRQNKVLNGTYINFVSKGSTSTKSNKIPSITEYLWLADKNGVLLKTIDGFYLSIKR